MDCLFYVTGEANIIDIFPVITYLYGDEDTEVGGYEMSIYLVRHGRDDEGYRGGWSQRGLNTEGYSKQYIGGI
ncbi:hypothetical protein D3C86_1927170 [compost metagenome]